MNIFKINFLGIVFYLLGIGNLSAQGFSAQGGVNISNFRVQRYEVGYPEEEAIRTHSGFNISINYEQKLWRKLYFKSGLFYNTKGRNDKYMFQGGSASIKETINYINVPLVVNMKINIDTSHQFFVSAGTYIGFAFSGKSITKVSYDGDLYDNEEFEYKWKAGEADNVYDLLDYGLRFGIGFEYKKFIYGIHYDLGLHNLISNTESKDKVYNSVFQYSLGYRF